MTFTTKAVLTSALAFLSSANALCTNSDAGVTGLINSDTNVAFVQGYYAFTDPTLSEQGGLQALPWTYPLDKCSIVRPSASYPYWKFTCQEDGTVLAEDFNDDSTCTGDVVQNHTLEANGTLVFNCGEGTTEAWFRAHMYTSSCGDTAADLQNTYAVVGEGMCETSTPNATADGYSNFYCDKQGLVISNYKVNEDMCEGVLCSQSTIDHGECGYLATTAPNGVSLDVYSRPLECMSAEDDQCHEEGAPQCSDAPTVSPTNMPTSWPTDMLLMSTTDEVDGDSGDASKLDFALVSKVLPALVVAVLLRF
jgi:hypothetical protein